MQIALGKRDHLIGATNAGEPQGVGWPISDFLAFIFKNDWKCTVSEFFGIKKIDIKQHNRWKTAFSSLKSAVFAGNLIEKSVELPRLRRAYVDFL